MPPHLLLASGPVDKSVFGISGYTADAPPHAASAPTPSELLVGPNLMFDHQQYTFSSVSPATATLSLPSVNATRDIDSYPYAPVAPLAPETPHLQAQSLPAAMSGMNNVYPPLPPPPYSLAPARSGMLEVTTPCNTTTATTSMRFDIWTGSSSGTYFSESPSETFDATDSAKHGDFMALGLGKTQWPSRFIEPAPDCTGPTVSTVVHQSYAYFTYDAAHTQ